ncbi:MAG: ParA family protein [Clostridium sp.]|nr:ParA family protein [Clostridium sp.]
MAIKISTVNNKGGVGKTTTTLVLAELLDYLGYRVLCIDLDAQSNLSLALHAYVEDSLAVIQRRTRPEKENIAELFLERYRTKEQVLTLVTPANIGKVKVIPSSKRFKNIDNDILRNSGNNNILLKRAIQSIDDEFDYILIDNAPASNILTVNSIVASDYILVPVRVEDFSYKGLKETMMDIAYIKEEHDLCVEFLGAFINQADRNTNAYKARRELYMKELQGRFFETAIRRDTKIEQMESKMTPMLKHNTASNALVDYAKLLLEMKIVDYSEAQILKKSIGEI